MKSRLLAAAVIAVVVEAGPATAEGCLERAARYAGVTTELLLAISWVESGWRLDAVNSANRNGTEDVCLMQVNSTHFSRLGTIGVTRDRLLNDGCACVLTGAHILKEMLRDSGGDVWAAVAAYNAGPRNPAAGEAYAERVRRALTAIRSGQLRGRGDIPTTEARTSRVRRAASASPSVTVVRGGGAAGGGEGADLERDLERLGADSGTGRRPATVRGRVR